MLMNTPAMRANPSRWRYASAWMACSVVGAVTSSIASSHSNLSSLRDLGVDIPLSMFTRQVTTDLMGIGPILLIFIAIGMVVAMSAGGLLRKKIKMLRPVVYIAAGMTAMLVMFLLMERAFFGTPIIQGARTASGLAIQMLCGGLGGATFAALSRPKS